jgi:hypothetical protein
MRRRDFIKSTALLPVVPGQRARQSLNDILNPQQVAVRTPYEMAVAVREADQSLESFARDAATTIAPEYRQIREDAAPIGSAASVYDVEQLPGDAGFTANALGPIYKLTEVVSDAYGVQLPNLWIISAAGGLAELSGVGSVLVAAKNVGETAVEIDERVAADEQIEQSLYDEFYLASLLLAVNLVLWQTAVSYRLAWRTTRYANNRLLFRLRRVQGGNLVLAVVMSLFHWSVRQGFEDAVTSIGDLVNFADDVVSELTERVGDLDAGEPGVDADAPSVQELTTALSGATNISLTEG